MRKEPSVPSREKPYWWWDEFSFSARFQCGGCHFFLFFPGGKQCSPNLGRSDEPFFLAIVSDFPPWMAEMVERRFAKDSVNSRSGSEELALATVILLTGKWSCHSWSWCVEPRSRHLHVAASLSFLHERVEERCHSLLHHLDKMGWDTRGNLKETGLIKMEGRVFWSDRQLQIRKKWHNVGPRQEELDTMEMRFVSHRSIFLGGIEIFVPGFCCLRGKRKRERERCWKCWCWSRI